MPPEISVVGTHVNYAAQRRLDGAVLSRSRSVNDKVECG
jgi:hypothetical protein